MSILDIFFAGGKFSAEICKICEIRSMRKLINKRYFEVHDIFDDIFLLGTFPKFSEISGNLSFKLTPMTSCFCSPASNYMFKVNNRNTRSRCQKCSKLTIKTSEHSGEHFSHLDLVFLLLTLSR